MSRSRNVKPGTFQNEFLAQCDPLARLLFIGLWCEADRAGRLEDRPARLRAKCLPYDDTNVDALLAQLAERGFIERYQVGGTGYIQVVNFAKHQNPHAREIASTIPSQEQAGHNLGNVEAQPRQCRAEKCIGSARLIPDSPIPIPSSGSQQEHEQQAPRTSSKSANRFAEWWSHYPVKKGRAAALKTWQAKSFDGIADKIIADTLKRAAEDRQWREGFIPHGSTYINARGWEDDIVPARTPSGAFKPRANDSFEGKRYTGTPDEQLPPELRPEVAQSGGRPAALMEAGNA